MLDQYSCFALSFTFRASIAGFQHFVIRRLEWRLLQTAGELLRFACGR